MAIVFSLRSTNPHDRPLAIKVLPTPPFTFNSTLHKNHKHQKHASAADRQTCPLLCFVAFNDPPFNKTNILGCSACLLHNQPTITTKLVTKKATSTAPVDCCVRVFWH